MTPPLPESEPLRRSEAKPPGAFSEAPPLAARESVHFIRRLLHLAPDIVYVYEFTTQKLLYVNRRLTDVLGYTEADLPALDHSLVNLVISPEPAQLGAYITRRFAEADDGETIEYEFMVRHKDGSPRVLRTRSTVLRRDAAGQPAEVVGISEDITAERETRDELRRREAQLVESQRLFQYGSWEWEVGTDLVRWSDELVRIFGYDPARISGPMLFGFYLDHIPPDERAQFEALMSQIIVTRQASVEFEHDIITSTGLRKRLRVRGSVGRDESGKVVAFHGTSADITAEYEAAARLREGEAVRNDTERFFGYGSWVWNLTGSQEYYWSEGNVRLFGYEPEEIPGGQVSFDFVLRHVHEDDREAFLAATRESLRQREPELTLEYRIVSKRGEIRRILRRARLVLDEHGHPLRYLGNNADVTEERRLAEQLTRSEELNRRINEFSPDYISIYDVKTGHSRYVGRHLRTLLGFSEAEVEKHGGTLFFALDGPDEWEKVRAFTAKIPALADSHFLTCKVTMRAKDGRRVVIQSRSTVFSRAADGQVAELMNVTQDVTEREETTEALRRSEALNRRLSELSPDFINILDLKTGQNQPVGSALYHWLGYSREEYEQHGNEYLFAFDSDEDRQQRQENLARVATLPDGESLTLKTSLRAKDGRRVVVENRVTVFSRDETGQPRELMTVSRDVTELETQTEALRQSEAFNRRLVALSPDVIGLYDLQSRHSRYVSDTTLPQWFGYTPDEVEALGGNLLGQFWNEGEKRQFEAGFAHALRTLTDGKVTSFTMRMRRKDGSLLVLFVRVSVFRRGSDGQPLELLSIYQDVTERDAQAERIRQSERFNRRLVELSPDIVSVFDLPTQRMHSVGSRTLGQLLGFTGEDVERAPGSLLGPFWDAAEEQHARGLLREIGALPDGETRAYTVRMRHKQGHAVTLFVRSSVFSRDETGQPRELMSVSQDVTLREQLFQQLQLRDDLLAEAQTLLKFGGWELPTPGEDAYWTPGLYRVMGHDLASLPAEQSTTALFAAGVHPDDAPALAERFEYAFATGEAFSYEYRFQWPNGEWRLHAGRGRGFTNSDGHIRLVGATTDVTDERRLFRNLERSEALLSQTEESLQFGSWEWDVPTQRITWSAGLWRVFGYPDREGTYPVTTDLFFSHLHPADRATMEAIIRHAFTQPEPFEFEYRITDAHGRPRLLAGQGVPLFDEKGQLTRLVGNTRDVTGEKEAAEALKKTEALLSEAEASLAMGTWDWDVTTSLVSWSPGQWGIFGYEKKDRPPASLDLYYHHVHPDDVSRMKHVLGQAMSEARPFQFEYRAVTAAGEERAIQGRGVPILDAAGRLVRFLGNNIDITAEKNAAERVRKQELLLREAETLLRFGSWEWDAQTGVLRWSEGLYCVFGYGADNRPNPLAMDVLVRHLHPDDAGENARLQNLILTEKPATFDSEFRIRTAGGEERWLHQRGLTFFDEAGQLLRLIGSTADVTKLKTYQLELEQRLKDLHRSNAELEQFAYVASHDLQEPLRKITAFGGRLATKHAANLGAEGRLYLERMIEAGVRMQVLIDNLLGFSRVARQVGDAVPTALEATVRSVLSDLELKIADKQALVDVGPLPILTAIPSQMQQLFQNLLTNALKFSQEGVPPVIRVRSEHVSTQEKITHRLDSGKKYARITVQDNGIGFDPVYAEKIFDLFQRLHGRSEYEGTGLGLAIVKKIVENHHGTIFAESTPGHGARFTVLLPLEP